MEIIAILLPMAIGLGLFFIGSFIWSAKKGQYDDLETPRFRMLLDDKNISHQINSTTKRTENE